MNKGIHLVGGNFFNFASPELSEYTIQDIARNLSHICRFTGSVNKFYGVSQHSIYVSLLLESWGYPVDIQMAGLMHDASEAFLGDVASPLKQLLPDYRKIEHKVESTIMKKYGISFPFEKVVKKADNAVFVAEREDLQPKCPQGLVYEGLTVERAPFKIVPWTSEKSQKEFLKRYFELGGVDK